MSADDRPLLVALHGHGDQPSTAEEWGRRVAGEDWRVLAVAAPEETPGVRSWFATGPRGADAEMIAEQLAVIADAVDATRNDSPVVLAGFSQGAAMVFEALLAGLDIDAAVGVAGFVAEHERGAGERANSSVRSTPLLAVAGRDDDVVPSFFSEDAAAMLAAEGVPVQFESVEGGHEVGGAAITTIAAWLDALFPTGRP